MYVYTSYPWGASFLPYAVREEGKVNRLYWRVAGKEEQPLVKGNEGPVDGIECTYSSLHTHGMSKGGRNKT